MGNLTSTDTSESAPMILLAGAHKSGKSCLARALCGEGDTGSFSGYTPDGEYYPTNGMMQCSLGGLRLVENGGGSERGSRE